jgi:[acyl-carrier-protein] S-malonyltransferase
MSTIRLDEPAAETPPCRAAGFPGQGVDWASTVSIIESRATDRRSLQFFERVGLRSLDGVLPTDTRVCQPAIFVASMLLADGVRLDGGDDGGDGTGVTSGPTAMAAVGHSFGELAALVFGGVFEFADGLELAARRGELGEESQQRFEGQMLAVIGADPEEVEYRRRLAIAAVAPTMPAALEVAVINHPLQVVLSGTPACVAAFADSIRSATVRCKPLPIGGAFHTPAMANAAVGYAEETARITPHAARISVVLSSGGGMIEAGSSPLDLPQRLARSLVMLVDWPNTLSRLAALGVTSGIDVGPGTTLSRIGRRAGMRFEPVG